MGKAKTRKYQSDLRIVKKRQTDAKRYEDFMTKHKEEQAQIQEQHKLDMRENPMAHVLPTMLRWMAR